MNHQFHIFNGLNSVFLSMIVNDIFLSLLKWDVNLNRLFKTNKWDYLSKLSKIHLAVPIFEQGIPPAWTQEAYQPRRIKYSICYPRWGTPPQPGLTGVTRGGYSLAGVPPRSGLMGVPKVGYPQPGLTGGTQGGVPPGRLDRPNGGYLRWGTPPHQQGSPLDLARVPPH